MNRRRARQRARYLRREQTKSEGLLWSVLRARQVCGLKFRRQQPVGPWIADFACPEMMLIIEVDGEFHDVTRARDIQRQKCLELAGWKVLRFSREDVEQDAEVVARAIANALGLPFEFTRRQGTGAGMWSAAGNSRAGNDGPSPR